MCAAYLEYREPIRIGVAWNVGNQLGCQFLGMGTNSDAAKTTIDRLTMSLLTNNVNIIL